MGPDTAAKWGLITLGLCLELVELAREYNHRVSQCGEVVIHGIQPSRKLALDDVCKNTIFKVGLAASDANKMGLLLGNERNRNYLLPKEQNQARPRGPGRDVDKGK